VEETQLDEFSDGITGVKAVKRALDVLSCFTLEAPELSLLDISAQTELPKATVHRLLATLVQEEFIVQDPETSIYKLGPMILVLGVIARSQINYLKKAEQVFRGLVSDVDETIAVASLDGDHHVCTLVVEPDRSVRVTTSVGVRRPCYFGAAGLVLLAYQPDTVLDKILPSDKLEAFTVWSTTDPVDYRRRLATIREHGYAIEKGEAFPDVTAMAAPIFDHQGKIVAAAAIVAPSHRVPDDRIGILIRKLTEATSEISHQLGASQNLTETMFLTG
jgi:DNA-binding IclR family transcriptional regulator